MLGQKELVMRFEITNDVVPRYKELSVTALLAEVKDDVEVMKYLPDMEEGARTISRKYLIKILFRLRPD